MKLNELIGVKSRIASDARVHNVLKQEGFTPVGSGLYATVYAHPQLPYVLKIFQVKDHAYLNFVKMAQQHNNPHFPKFRGKPMRITPEYYAIRMETLSDWSANSASILDRALVHISGITDDLPDWRHIFDAPYDEETKRALKVFFQRWPKFLDALILLQEFEQTQQGVHFDLHFENIMKRGNTPVITDPFSSGIY